MSVINTDTCFKPEGYRQTFTPAAASSSKEGLLLRMHHTIVMGHGNANQCIRFLHVSFNGSGECLAASNHLGNVYIFDFALHKYWLMAHVNCATVRFVSAGMRVPNAKGMLIVCTTVGVIHVYDSHTCSTIGKLVGHKHPVMDIAFSECVECVTVANNEAILWNLENFTKMKVLCLEMGAVLKFIMFVPVSNDVLACFNDESIQIWKSHTFESDRQMKQINRFIIKSIAFTSDGKLMALVGHAPVIYVFYVENLQLQKEFTFSDIHVTVKRAQFLPNLFDDGVNKILSFLVSSGTLFFYNMEMEVFLTKLTVDSEVWKYAIDSTANRIATISKAGQVYVHSLPYILNKHNRGKFGRCLTDNKRPLKKKSKEKKKVNAIFKELSNVLDIDKLKSILKEFGEYPSLYRKIIWRHLLQLPNDETQYEAISSHVDEQATSDFEKHYPLDVKHDMKNLKRFLGDLVTWCPFLSVVSYLPVLIFPFIKFLHSEPVQCFETLICLIVNFCQFWFEYHPVPPLNILGIVESILLQQDYELMSFFNFKGVTSKTYAWFLLQSMFSEVLSSANWLIFCDHLVTYHAAFLIVAVAAYSMINRSVLLTFDTIDDFEFFYRTNYPINFKRFIALCYKLLNNSTIENHPRLYLKTLQRFPNDEYPIFDQYPKSCMEVCQSINSLRSEVNSLKKKEHKVEQLKNLKQLEINSEEYMRHAQLQKLYCDTLDEEKQNLIEQKQRINLLKCKLQAKEVEREKEILFSIKNGKNHIKDDKKLNHSKECGDNEFGKVEENLLKHYTNLLKYKIQIEGLIDEDVSLDLVQLKKSYKQISDEINKAQKKMTIPNKEYLKQLNVVTGIAAVNSLIQKVETKIANRGSITKTNSKHLVSKLASESEELSREINQLLTLLGESQ